MTNETHDPSLKSWVESANDGRTDFPIQNLPYGAFAPAGQPARIGVAIGDEILDLAAVEAAGLVAPCAGGFVFDRPRLNDFMALGPAVWRETRLRISELLREGDTRIDRTRMLTPMAAATLHMPFQVSEYTDFYASREHATNVGTMFRGRENALPPNWLHIPIGYNGRASTVVASGAPITRPLGQLKGKDDPAPRFGPCERLDIELEMGAVIGQPSAMGEPITIDRAAEMIFGYVLLNDWSARDIQVWEYQPLGPFQAKAFGTTISPWVVTSEALEPHRAAGPAPELPLLPYLREARPGLFDIELDVTLTPAGGEAHRISRTNYRGMYFSAAQQLAHHAVGGCAMNVGDLLGSGTISGATPDSVGSLLEATWNGERPLNLAGQRRVFLEDGDEVTLTGRAQGDGHRIGFGACAGRIAPSPAMPTGW